MLAIVTPNTNTVYTFKFLRVDSNPIKLMLRSFNFFDNVLRHSGEVRNSAYFTPSVHQRQYSVIIPGLLELWLELPSLRFEGPRDPWNFPQAAALKIMKLLLNCGKEEISSS